MHLLFFLFATSLLNCVSSQDSNTDGSEIVNTHNKRVVQKFGDPLIDWCSKRHCKGCREGRFCTSCKQGWKLDKILHVTKCVKGDAIEHCARYDDKTATCTKCKSGFKVHEGTTCIPSNRFPNGLLLNTPMRILNLYVAVDRSFLRKYIIGSEKNALSTVKTMVDKAKKVFKRDLFITINVVKTAIVDVDRSLDSMKSLLKTQRSKGKEIDALIGLFGGKIFEMEHNGIAWLGDVCSDYAAGYADFKRSTEDLSTATFIHELGHIVGGPHSHEFEPPVDNCGTSSGWGAFTEEAIPKNGGGSVLSYCHSQSLFGGGKARALAFGAYGKYGYKSERINQKIREVVDAQASRTCLRLSPEKPLYAEEVIREEEVLEEADEEGALIDNASNTTKLENGEDEDSSDGLPGWAIAMIVVGSVLVVVGLIIVVVVFRSKSVEPDYV